MVFGHGRTGSHLVADVLRAVIEYQQPRSDKIVDPAAWTQAPAGSVFHTNFVPVVIELMQAGPKDQTRLVVTGRWNVFATVVSNLIAQYSKEWSVYTDRVFEPIDIDPDLFYQQMSDMVALYTIVLPRRPLSGYRDITYVTFEDIVASQNKERWLADKIGLPYQGPGLIWSNKNTRNYQQMIANYHDLNSRFNHAEFINRLWRSNGDCNRYPWMSR